MNIDELKEKGKRAESGCLEWQGRRTRRGYGKLSVNGKNVLVHRYSYFLTHGEYPPHYCCHRCDNPSCFEPDHLFAGTPKENYLDCLNKGRYRGLSHNNRIATHCVNGHEFTEANTYVRHDGKGIRRDCRTCDREKKRRGEAQWGRGRLPQRL